MDGAVSISALWGLKPIQNILRKFQKEYRMNYLTGAALHPIHLTTAICRLTLSILILFLFPATTLSRTTSEEKAFEHLYEVMDGSGVSLEKPQFLTSYQILVPGTETDTKLVNTSFSYDNALVLLAFLSRGTPEDMRRAKAIADAFLYVQRNDRYYKDGRFRNAYKSGNFIDSYNKKAMLPGWWDPYRREWCEDKEQVGTSTGNMAWIGLALLTYYQKAPGKPYLEAALTIAEWIRNHTETSSGYSGGYIGWEPTPQKITWRSTEHNLDVYVFFSRLYQATKDPAWEKGSRIAKQFIAGMWDENETHFWTGTTPDGLQINTRTIPLDIQAWAIQAMPGEKRYHGALNWSEKNCGTTADGFTGFDFNNDRDGIWFEGTAQMALAYHIIGQNDRASNILKELRKVQNYGPGANGKGLIAASHDGVTTGFEWKYFAKLHIGATAWLLFVEMRYNPFWNYSSPWTGPKGGWDTDQRTAGRR